MGEIIIIHASNNCAFAKKIRTRHRREGTLLVDTPSIATRRDMASVSAALDAHEEMRDASSWMRTSNVQVRIRCCQP